MHVCVCVSECVYFVCVSVREGCLHVGVTEVSFSRGEAINQHAERKPKQRERETTQMQPALRRRAWQTDSTLEMGIKSYTSNSSVTTSSGIRDLKKEKMTTTLGRLMLQEKDVINVVSKSKSLC